MKNFKEIAEKCLASELSGRFKNRKGESIPSRGLFRASSKKYPYTFYYSRHFTIHGEYFNSHELSEYDIIDFIPDNMQEQIKIDVPEGKVPVMERTEKGVFITWKEKELTYNNISNHIWKQGTQIGVLTSAVVNENTNKFSKKVEVLRKLIMIRNYFGKPDNLLEGWCIAYSKQYNTFTVNYINAADRWFSGILFKEGEHAGQAIKMLGDELKYLFEPW